MIENDRSLIRRTAESGQRIDNRSFDAYRDITIETGVITSAEGSARVRVGNTEVVAGVKMDTGEPFSDTPDEGVLMVAAEFVPLASPDFEPGPPREGAIEVSRVVDRAIRESKAIDFEKLCIKAGEKVWMLYVDIDVMDDDGNLIDACGIAAIAALIDASMPKLDENGKVLYGEKGAEKLPISGIPVSTTIAKVGSVIMADPSKAEDRSMDARLTVGTVDKDGKILLCSMQKGGTNGMTPEEIEKAISLAMEKGEEIRRLIREKCA